MRADTAAIEHAGTALATCSAEVRALATTLPAIIDPLPALLGPVAGALVAALREALTHTTHTVTELGTHLALAGETAGRTAVSYRDAEHHAGQSISTVGG